jgi:hypothetical protein
VSLSANHLVDVQLFEALEPDKCYLYGASIADRASLEEGAVKRLLADHALRASVGRLDAIVDLPGASAGFPAPFHYVVETDVLPEHEADFNRWYDREHLPGLAAVPGTVRARRFRNPDGSPRYHACYDVVSPSTVGSPAWILVRATAWSQRVRPAFRNTRRTMFRRMTP